MSTLLAALFSQGNALFRQRRFDEALAAYDDALLMSPDHPRILLNRGQTLRNLGRFDEALADLQAAADREPAAVEALTARAEILLSLRRTAPLIATLEAALRRCPDKAALHANLGIALRLDGRPREAIAAFQDALSLDPEGAYWPFIGACHLTLGELEAGWRAFEHRLEPAAAAPLLTRAPRWKGEPLHGKTVAVYAEQGLGDTIMFCRYLPAMAAAGASVLFAPQPSLRRLLGRLNAPPGAIRIIDPAEPDLTVDYRLRTMSLPFAHGTRLDSIPGTAPYLSAEPALVAAWRGRLGETGFKIGVAWRGSPHAADQQRDFDPAHLAPLAGLPGVRLISLQKQESGRDADIMAALGIETPHPELDAGGHAFIDSAAIMSSLDLVVSLDSAIAHLAGALARPTWIALPRYAEWRWLTDREDTPWYPTARLWRQTAPARWDDVFEAMAAELAARR